MAPPTDSQFLDEANARVRSQIMMDPGLPPQYPTVPTWQIPPHRTAAIQSTKVCSVTDFAVIGSGVTGCSVAQTLLEDSRSEDKTVIVFEARTIASGATGRNAGFLQSHIPRQFKSLVEKFGRDEAMAIAKFCKRTLQKMHNLIEFGGTELREASEIRKVRFLAVFRDEPVFDTANASVQSYEEAFPDEEGMYTAFNTKEAAEEFNLRDAVGIQSAQGTVFWPYRLITRVFESLLQKYPTRLSIEANTPILSVRYSPRGDDEHPYILDTSRGIFRARHVFHCTNAFSSHLLPKIRGKIFPTRHTMSCQVPGPSFPNLGAERSWMFYKTPTHDEQTGILDTGIKYMQQNARTGELFFGGDTDVLENMINSDDAGINSHSKNYIATALPQIFENGWNDPVSGDALTPEISNVWSGIIGNTADKVPLVGRLPPSVSDGDDNAGEWIAAGFNGYGMPQCWSSGEAIAKMALGEPVPEWLPTTLWCTEERLEGLTIDAAARSLA